jgi:peptidoglycan/LPS O-acetylase OafA/YrhL
MLRALLAICFVAIAAGSFLPWSESGPFSETGVEGNGVATLVLAVAGVLATALGRRPRAVLIAVSSAIVCLIVALLDFSDVSSGGSDVGSGLYLTLGASIAATALASLQTFRSLRRPEAPQVGPDSATGS